MAYKRINVYRAICSKHLLADCQISGPESPSIDRCYTNAIEDGWKQIKDRELMCPQCLRHMNQGIIYLEGKR